MKGIVLAGGSGTRLYPITMTVTKHLLPIYDKPLIYYPLSILLLCGIKDVLIITTSEDVRQYRKLLKDGSQLGIKICYQVQDEPRGIAEALIIGEEFIGDDNVALILGDNVFYGQGFSEILSRATKVKDGAIIFGYPVINPEEFGVVQFDNNGQVLSLEENQSVQNLNMLYRACTFMIMM